MCVVLCCRGTVETAILNYILTILFVLIFVEFVCNPINTNDDIKFSFGSRSTNQYRTRFLLLVSFQSTYPLASRTTRLGPFWFSQETSASARSVISSDSCYVANQLVAARRFRHKLHHKNVSSFLAVDNYEYKIFGLICDPLLMSFYFRPQRTCTVHVQCASRQYFGKIGI